MSPPKRHKQQRHFPQPAGGVDHDWFLKKMAERKISQNALARVLKTQPASLSRTMKGLRKPQLSEAIALAEYLDVSFSDVVSKFGYALPRRRVQIVGKITPECRVSALTNRVNEYVDAPSETDEDCKALVFTTANSPMQSYDDGLVFWCPSSLVDAHAFGRLSIVGIDGHDLAVIGTVERASGGKIRVILLNGKVVEATKLLNASPVRWMRSA